MKYIVPIALLLVSCSGVTPPQDKLYALQELNHREHLDNTDPKALTRDKRLWKKFKTEEPEGKYDYYTLDHQRGQRIFAWQVLETSIIHQDQQLGKELLGYLKRNESNYFNLFYDDDNKLKQQPPILEDFRNFVAKRKVDQQTYLNAQLLWEKFKDEEVQRVSDPVTLDPVYNAEKTRKLSLTWILLELSIAHDDAKLAKDLIKYLQRHDSIAWWSIYYDA